MKKIFIILGLFVFIFLVSASVKAQNISKKTMEKKISISRVVLEITASTNIGNKKNVLETDLPLKISQLKPLCYMKIDNKDGINNLILKFRFRNLNSFYKWYNNKRIKDILEKIKTYAPNYKTELEFTKTI